MIPNGFIMDSLVRNDCIMYVYIYMYSIKWTISDSFFLCVPDPADCLCWMEVYGAIALAILKDQEPRYRFWLKNKKWLSTWDAFKPMFFSSMFSTGSCNSSSSWLHGHSGIQGILLESFLERFYIDPEWQHDWVRNRTKRPLNVFCANNYLSW